MGPIEATRPKRDSRPSPEASLYTGKEGYATTAYEVTMDHAGRVMGLTTGFTRPQSDKSIVWF